MTLNFTNRKTDITTIVIVTIFLLVYIFGVAYGHRADSNAAKDANTAAAQPVTVTPPVTPVDQTPPVTPVETVAPVSVPVVPTVQSTTPKVRTRKDD